MTSLLASFGDRTDSWKVCEEGTLNQMNPLDIGASTEVRVTVTSSLQVRPEESIILQVEAPAPECDLLSVMVLWA